MPQRIRDYGIAALALAALLVALTQVDSRVPSRLTQAISDAANGRWNAPGSTLGNFMIDAAASPAFDNFFVFALLAAGVVLVILMVRT